MVNKVTLIGRLGKDPEIRTLDNGNKVSKFTIATSDNYKDKSGQWVENTDWHNVEIWKEVKAVKGDLVYLEGKIKTDSYEKDGKKQYTTKVVASYVRNLTPKSDGANGGANDGTGLGSPKKLDFDDDSLPF